MTGRGRSPQARPYCHCEASYYQHGQFGLEAVIRCFGHERGCGLVLFIHNGGELPFVAVAKAPRPHRRSGQSGNNQARSPFDQHQGRRSDVRRSQEGYPSGPSRWTFSGNLSALVLRAFEHHLCREPDQSCDYVFSGLSSKFDQTSCV